MSLIGNLVATKHHQLMQDGVIPRRWTDKLFSRGSI